MRTRARTTRGASVALLLAAAGCGLVAPLDGLTGGTLGGPEASTDGAAGGGEDGSSGAADAGHADGASGGDATNKDGSSSGGEAGAAGTDGAEGSTAEGGADVATESPPPPSIAFVQVAASSPNAAVASVEAKLTQAQAAGDLLVVAIGWFDATSSVSTVTDTAGDNFVLAIGPTRLGQDLSQSLYFAAGVHAAAAGGNTVTVAFVQTANVPDLRVLEYSGLAATSALDVTATGTGTSTGPATTAAIATTTARELLFAAGMTNQTYSGPGTGFSDRLVTTDGDLVEDRVVSTTGSYAGSAPLTQSAEWLIQMASFR